MAKLERWKGRHADKDALRRSVWQTLEETGAAIGDPWSTIPDFVGAEAAATRLNDLPVWQSAKVVKSNPDRAQAWVRLQALQQGKVVYTPVPELVQDFPFLLLDPEVLESKGVSFEAVMYSEGAIAHGQRVQFADIAPIDFFVVGSVAVTRDGGRTGKGAGFADLEMGVFRHYGAISADTPIVTTVHDSQLVDDNLIVMQAHDNGLNLIATPSELIETTAAYSVPGPIDWSRVQPDQFQNIPFLETLRAEIEQTN